ncbi:MAG: hypothetical protein R2827_15925 [Bdellovibrionales bacterium]
MNNSTDSDTLRYIQSLIQQGDLRTATKELSIAASAKPRSKAIERAKSLLEKAYATGVQQRSLASKPVRF